MVKELWGGEDKPGQVTERRYGSGTIFWGGALAPEPPAMKDENGIARSHWIWCAEDTSALAAPPGRRYFTRKFALSSKPDSAAFSITADNGFRCWINGNRAGRGENFTQVYEFDIRDLLQPGENLVAVEVKNGGDTPNPAGMIAMVELESADGSRSRIPSDAQWQSASTTPDHWREDPVVTADWPSARVIGPMGTPPWGKIGTVNVPENHYPPSHAIETLLEKRGIAPTRDQPFAIHINIRLRRPVFVATAQRPLLKKLVPLNRGATVLPKTGFAIIIEDDRTSFPSA